jgi:hypothetical protein
MEDPLTHIWGFLMGKRGPEAIKGTKGNLLGKRPHSLYRHRRSLGKAGEHALDANTIAQVKVARRPHNGHSPPSMA